MALYNTATHYRKLDRRDSDNLSLPAAKKHNSYHPETEGGFSIVEATALLKLKCSSVSDMGGRLLINTDIQWIYIYII